MKGERFRGSKRCLFFKQKTAYEMRISDWSSDVCSSDLVVCGLEDPAPSPGLNIEGHQCAGYLIVDRATLSAIMVRRGIAGRNVNQAQLPVIGHLCPAVRGRGGIGIAGGRGADPIRRAAKIRGASGRERMGREW